MLKFKPLFLLLLLFNFANFKIFAQQDTIKGVGSEVVVTGQYSPQPLRSSVYKVKTITAERIKMRAATDIVGVLNSELGIRFSTDNSLGETDTKILGLGGTRVKILIDGVPMADRDATKQSINQIDINSIEKIEIVEGPMSVIYGTDALAGVINIITKKGSKNGNHLSVGLKIQEEGIGNTYVPLTKNGIHNQNLSVNWNNNKYRASAYLTRNDFGGFADTAAYPAKVFRPKKQWMTGGTVGYKNSNFDIWYRVDFLHEELLSASPMSLTTYKSFRQYYYTKRYTHQLQSIWNINKELKLNSAVSFQDYNRTTESYTLDYRTGINSPNKTKQDIESGYWDVTPFQSLFARTALSWIVSSKISLQPGLEFKQDKTSGERVSGSPSISDFSFFISSEIKPTSKINIRPGLRLSKNSVYDAPPIIPSINTKFTLNKLLDLRLSYARGFRAPILRELYFNFYDANHNIKGNTNLKAETSNSFMATITCNAITKNHFSYASTITGFYNSYKDFIDLYDYIDNNGVATFSYFNRDNFKTKGITFENNLSYKNLVAGIGLSYIGYYNRFQENNTLQGNTAKFAWSPEISTNITYHLKKLKGSIGMYYKFTGQIPTFSLGTNNDIVLSKRNAFHWADLTATKQLFKLITLQAGIKNLFDVGRLGSTSTIAGNQHGAGSVINYAYGRSYFITINFQWSKK